MAKDFYDQKDQRIYYVHEETYGTPLEGTAWTAPGETYPFWQRFNIIGESIDTPVPKRAKTKIYDVGSGKHPSHVINNMIEQEDYTLDMELQDATMFAYAVGNATHAGTGSEEAGTITCVADDGDDLDGTYFFIESIDTDDNGDPQLYCVWIDVDDSGTAYPGPTEIPAGNRKECTTIETDDTDAEVAAEIELVIETLDIDSSATDEVITWTADNKGSCIKARDSAVAPTGFTFTNTTAGTSTITITEALGRQLQSFTMYVEQKNQSGAGEDVCYVYFGCTISGYSITIDRETHTVKQSVSFSCPYAIAGNLATEPPPISRRHPFTWNQLQTDELALSVDGTSYLPKSTNNIALTIENNLEIKPEVGSLYNQHPITGKRDIALTASGFTDSNDLYELYLDIWDNDDGYFDGAADRLESDINLERTASTDYFRIYVYNWIVETHDFKVFSITDAIKGIDIALTGGTPDRTTNVGELLTDGTNRCTVVTTDNLRKYHNT